MPRSLAAIDLGSHQIKLVVGQTVGQDLTITGAVHERSRGIQGGLITSLEQAVLSISDALDAAQLMVGAQINRIYLSVSGDFIQSQNSVGFIGVTNGGMIGEEHVRRVRESTQPTLPPDQMVLNVFDQEYRVDAQHGILNPRGMVGSRLELHAHVVRANKNALANLRNALQSVNIKVEGILLGQMADAQGVLREEEKQHGVALVNIGETMTTLGIFSKGAIRHSCVLPLGGEGFTRDLGFLLNVPKEHAEKLKKRDGSVFLPYVDDGEYVDIGPITGQERLIKQRYFIECLQPRARQLFRSVYEEIKRSGYLETLHHGLVLSGGGSLLNGMVDLASGLFQMPVRLGKPQGVGGLSEMVSIPFYSTSVGLLKHFWHTRQDGPSEGGKGIKTVLERIKDFLLKEDS
jgi:cell division protein FtsA